LDPGHSWRACSSSCTVICSLVARWNLFTPNQCINNPLDTFLALDHFNDQLSLNDLVIFENVRLKLLVASADLSNYIIRLLLEMNLIDSHQVKGTFNVHNRNSDIVFVNQSLKVRFEFDVLPQIKFNWWLLEQLLALIIDFSIRNAGVFRMALNVMLILSRLINLLLLDSSNHFFLLNIEALQFSAKLHFLIVIELDQLLSFIFFELSSLFYNLILLILYSIISIPLSLQINFPSFPKILFFSLCYDI